MVKQPPAIADTAHVEEVLAESEADVAAGRTVPLAAVLDRIRQSITQMEARREANERLTAKV